MEKSDKLPQNLTSDSILETSPTNTRTGKKDKPSEENKQTLIIKEMCKNLCEEIEECEDE